MKKRLALLSLAIGVALGMSAFGQTPANSTEKPKDELRNLRFMSETDLKQQFAAMQKNTAFATVLAGLKQRGFVKLEMKEGNWGFTGEYNAGNGVFEKARFLSYDFYNPKAGKGGQGASIIMRQVGSNTYTAYLVFPEGEVTADEALAKSEEWYVDDQNKLQLAKSWGRCFLREVREDCALRCLIAVGLCTGLYVALGVATGGIGFSAGVAIFAQCAGDFCAPCLARQAIQCLF